MKNLPRLLLVTGLTGLLLPTLLRAGAHVHSGPAQAIAAVAALALIVSLFFLEPRPQSAAARPRPSVPVFRSARAGEDDFMPAPEMENPDNYSLQS